MLKKIWKELKLPLIVVLLISLIRSLFINYYTIPSGSMYPNLSIGDYIIVNRMAYGTHIPFANTNLIEWNLPERGDIVVFYAPSGTVMVKRVVGLPGDTITINNDQLYINNNKVEYEASDSEFDNDETFPLAKYQKLKKEKFKSADHFILTIDKDIMEKNKFVYPTGIKWRESTITAGEDELILIGDNRNNSVDSRFWGTIKTNKLIGKVIYKF